MKKIYSLIIFILGLNVAYAQDEEIETDRPGESQSASIVKQHSMQIEQGFQVQKDTGVSITESNSLFRYGISKNIELRLEADIMHSPSTKSSPSATELQPVEIGTKVELCDQKKWLPKTALLVQVGLPFLASSSFKNFNLIPKLRLSFENDLSKIISWNYNAGAEWDGETSDPEYIYTFSNVIDFSKKVSGFVEVFGSAKDHELPQQNIDAGLLLLINKNLKIDISSGAGISKSAPDWAIGIGASLRF